ncbi:transcriptional regulator [Bacillus cereus]|uniref:helix-turn-helix domain-containing protein n=2 Tax=Bacillus cereus group TaxID=86661 RepID=UPI0009777EAB|nr:helix-turn-helix transcriptional regulator [Bacillus cytotoxicus]ONG97466.1 transcriptional regulator [Bacillus cereus]HDR7741143.1 helix-turn-helix transcriptional regulator [Bacillus pacificus]MDH2866132.1 helix-turn-helix transcriptional regulator [Bacillus cytotoxicus]NZD34375.1 helix-turn-helix transcriptional regulator [Bacillus cytotoxicus]HDR7214421.1 helix-turn-helix transcriptional regulator [Bacillus cytotoxicus]
MSNEQNQISHKKDRKNSTKSIDQRLEKLEMTLKLLDISFDELVGLVTYYRAEKQKSNESMERSGQLKWNLDKLMLEMNLNIDQVATIVGLHRNQIGKIKNHDFKRTDLKTIERISKGLNVSLDELFRYEKDDSV